MKKLLIALSALFIMSGCDETTDSLTCTSTTTTGNMVTKTTYNIDYVGDDVKYATITYDYSQTNKDNTDGINADTDGLDEERSNTLNSDDVVDGVVGDVIDETVQGVTETILDIAGIKNRYENMLSTYDNMEGLSYNVDVNTNNEYKIIYKIDMNKISDNDLTNFDITRDFSDMKANYEKLGYTCK